MVNFAQDFTDNQKNEPVVRRIKAKVLVGFVLVGIALAIAFAMIDAFGKRKDQLIWSAGSGAATPGKFTFVMFPKDNDVVLLDQNGSLTPHHLSRAVACADDELRENTMSVFVGNDEFFAPLDKLTFVPPPNADEYLNNWKAAVRGWGKNTYWPEVDLTIQTALGQKWLITLTRTSWTRETDWFEYSVDADGTAKPVSWKVRSSKAAAFGK